MCTSCTNLSYGGKVRTCNLLGASLIVCAVAIAALALPKSTLSAGFSYKAAIATTVLTSLISATCLYILFLNRPKKVPNRPIQEPPPPPRVITVVGGTFAPIEALAAQNRTFADRLAAARRELEQQLPTYKPEVQLGERQQFSGSARALQRLLDERILDLLREAPTSEEFQAVLDLHGEIVNRANEIQQHYTVVRTEFNIERPQTPSFDEWMQQVETQAEFGALLVYFGRQKEFAKVWDAWEQLDIFVHPDSNFATKAEAFVEFVERLPERVESQAVRERLNVKVNTLQLQQYLVEEQVDVARARDRICEMNRAHRIFERKVNSQELPEEHQLIQEVMDTSADAAVARRAQEEEDAKLARRLQLGLE
ncbi:MAG: hypothetical protein H7A36_00775 [Chlamydiales bacterium]|nr:hypothetical protein [Chlamydiales bacterium]